MLLESLKELGYRFTRPLEVRSSYLTEPTNNKMLRAVILDTETTGTDYMQDKLIELGMVAFEPPRLYRRVICLSPPPWQTQRIDYNTLPQLQQAECFL